MFRWFYHLGSLVRRERVLVLIIAGFIFIAMTGLFYNFGLATTVNDETPPFVAALKMIAEHTLRPAYSTFYYLPVAAYSLLPFALLAIVALPVLGVVASIDTLKEFVILNFAQLLPWARLASVFYGVLAIFVLYHIALRFFGRGSTALLATFFFSTSLLFVQLAHFGRVWSPMLLAILFTLWMTLKLFDEPTLRRYLFVGVGIALSFGFNMIGILVYVPFVVAHALKHKGKSFIEKFFLHRDFVFVHIILIGSVLLFYYLNPYGFENYIGFLKRFFLMFSTSSGAVQIISGGNTHFCGSGLVSGLIYYPRILIEYEFPLALFSLLGIIFFWTKVIEKRSEVAILGSFTAAYIVGITLISVLGINTCEPRYILPIVPVLALLSAIFVTAIREKVSRHFSLFVICAATLIALYGPVLFDLRLALPSTRLLAREWIIQNVPDGARMVMFDETLDISEDEETLRDIRRYAPYFLTKKRAFLLEVLPKQSSGPHYYVFTPAYFQGTIPSVLIAKHYDYLVVSWWNPDYRADRMTQIEQLGLPGTLERVARFPENATDATESIDLPNNMRDPLIRLPLLTQNGPVVDVYQIR